MLPTVYEHRRQPVASPVEFRHRIAKATALAIALVAFSLLLGVAGYRATENMPWTDALLNAAMLLGGMGPVGELKTHGGKIFASFFALYAGLVFIAVAGVVLGPLAHRMLHKFHADPEETGAEGENEDRRRPRGTRRS